MFFQVASFCSVISPFAFPGELWGLKNQFSSLKMLKQLIRLIGLPSSPDKADQLLLPAPYVKLFYPFFRKRKIKLEFILNVYPVNNCMHNGKEHGI